MLSRKTMVKRKNYNLNIHPDYFDFIDGFEFREANTRDESEDNTMFCTRRPATRLHWVDTVIQMVEPRPDGVRVLHRNVKRQSRFDVPNTESFYFALNFLMTRPEILWSHVYTSYIVPGTFNYKQRKNLTVDPSFGEDMFFRLLLLKDVEVLLQRVVKLVWFDRAIVMDNGHVVIFQEEWHFNKRRQGFLSTPKNRCANAAEEVHYKHLIALWSFSMTYHDSIPGLCSALVEIYTDPKELIRHNAMMDQIEHFMRYIFSTGTIAHWDQKNSSLRHRPSLLSIDRANYLKWYKELKAQTYEELKQVWVTNEQKTDPTKYIPEDLHIATYMQCLQSNSKSFLPFEKKFVDIGCGNGLLTHLLTQLGWKGYGIDLRKRTLWNYFTEKGAKYQESKVLYNTILDEVDSDTILIGNHPDELAPLIPLLAIQSGAGGFIIIPCCAFDIFGQKYVRPNSKLSVYESHIQTTVEACKSLGFEIQLDKLRIPSTKRVAILGRAPLPSVDDSHVEKHHEYFNNMMKSIAEYTGEPSSRRDNEFRVNNCSQLPRKECEDVLVRMFNYILSARCTTCDSCTNPDLQHGCLPQFFVGCRRVPLKTLSTLLTTDERNMLKNQGNGLQTLLRSYSDTFSIVKGNVAIELPCKHRLKRMRENEKMKKVHSRACFFFEHHIDGCPLKDEECAFAHDCPDKENEAMM